MIRQRRLALTTCGRVRVCRYTLGSGQDAPASTQISEVWGVPADNVAAAAFLLAVADASCARRLMLSLDRLSRLISDGVVVRRFCARPWGAGGCAPGAGTHEITCATSS